MQILLLFMYQDRRFSSVNHVILVQLILILAVMKVIACQCNCINAKEVGMNHIPC